MHRVLVYLKNQLTDARGNGLVRDIQDLGINKVRSIRVSDVFWLYDDGLSRAELELICRRVLTDSVIQDYYLNEPFSSAPANGITPIETAYNAGVADPVEETVLKAIADLGVKGLEAVRTGTRYLIEGNLSDTEINTITQRLLINPIIQHVVTKELKSLPAIPSYKFKLKHINLLNADDGLLAELTTKMGLSSDELKTITSYYKKEGRNPTDAELETLAQSWSEHCVHKTFKAKIDYNGQIIDNLLKSTIAKATYEMNKPWCLSVFEDNAGVIEFDAENAVCFKVETHNHPSAVEPYGGAATGIGGVVRDVLGTGLSARPFLNTDVFCFGPPDLPYDKLPPGVLHPRRVFKGVKSGVADYGNRLGIPTVNGAVLFDERYVGNPLVYCGTAGIMPKSCAMMGQQKPQDLVLLVGGRTGRDGIHGVTFASEQLTDESTDISFTAVQIGNPIVEKKVLDTVLKARDKKLFSRITDCGGGGLSSAAGEMGENTGVNIYLDRVPLKYAGLSYEEIWISESQERMVLAVPPENKEEILEIFASENVEATIIGEFTNDKRLRLFYNDTEVANLEMAFIHNGRPQSRLKAIWQKPHHPEAGFEAPASLNQDLLKTLGAYNVASKEWVIRQYDHEVQGSSVLKPLVGKNNDGPGDAAILRPVLGSKKGIIVSCGINPSYGDIDPYWMAASAIDESLRQIIAVGGNLERVALLDNFSWGDTGNEETLGALVRACQACYDLATVYQTPFISGKDSLNNEFYYQGKTITIPHTLLISAIAVMEDSERAVTMDFKEAGNYIYIVGETFNELGGSEYYKAHGFLGNGVPRVRPQQALETMTRLSQATDNKLVRACHDLSDGGLGVALAEMAFAGELGAEIDLAAIPLGEEIARDDFILFSESNSRFLVEVAPQHQEAFEMALADSPFSLIGSINNGDKLVITGYNKEVINLPISELKEAWQKPLRW
jgi:phosphoribosylformylglycinamidine synthase II